MKHATIRAASTALASLSVLALQGCALFQPAERPPEHDPVTVVDSATVKADCWAL